MYDSFLLLNRIHCVGRLHFVYRFTKLMDVWIVPQSCLIMQPKVIAYKFLLRERWNALDSQGDDFSQAIAIGRTFISEKYLQEKEEGLGFL